MKAPLLARGETVASPPARSGLHGEQSHPAHAPDAAALFPITLEGVGLRRGANWVLRDIDLQIARGGITALAGPNGSGKTSLLRLIHGLEIPTSGSLCFGGRAPVPDGMAYAAQAMVFAHTPMLRGTVADNLRLALDGAGCGTADPSGDAGQRLEAALRRAGLQGRAWQSAASLSSGQRQRLALARAWLCQPALLLLDEPCSHLDAQAAAGLLSDVQELAAQGITVLLSTHRPEELALAQRVLRLEGGRLHIASPLPQRLQRPCSDNPPGELPCPSLA